MRHILISSSCLIAFITLGTAAPIPKDVKKAPLYFPTKVGTKWVYEFGDGSTYTEAVTKVEEGKNGAVLVSAGRQFDDGVVDIAYKYEVSPKGLFVVAIDKDAYDPPICHFKLPFKAGEKWENMMTLQGNTLNHGPRSVVGIEKVEVPAGKYEAIRIEYWPSVKPGEKELRHSIWYAPDVGMVKLESTAKDYNVVLKSFTPGKN